MSNKIRLYEVECDINEEEFSFTADCSGNISVMSKEYGLTKITNIYFYINGFNRDFNEFKTNIFEYIPRFHVCVEYFIVGVIDDILEEDLKEELIKIIEGHIINNML